MLLVINSTVYNSINEKFTVRLNNNKSLLCAELLIDKTISPQYCIKDTYMDSKNIAIFIDTLGGGGAERIMLDLAKDMVTLGHKVHFFLLENTIDYQLPNNVYIHLFPSPLKRAKLTSVFQLSSTAKTMINMVQNVSKAHGQFDLMLVNLDSSNLVISRCALLSPDLFNNTYHVVHNSLHQEIKRAGRLNPIRYWRTIREKKALDKKSLIGVSQGVTSELLNSKWITPISATTIYNPCDIDAIRTLASQPNADIPTEPYLIHIGRVVRQKRHDILFEALKFVPDIKLVLLCKNTKKVRKLADKHGVTDRIITPSFQSNPYNWLKQARLKVFSSEFEGLGMVLIESLICGTPVVSTNCNFGPNEILTGKMSAYLAEVNNPRDLADKIIYALNANPVRISNDVKTAEIVDKVRLRSVANQYLQLIK